MENLSSGQMVINNPADISVIVGYFIVVIMSAFGDTGTARHIGCWYVCSSIHIFAVPYTFLMQTVTFGGLAAL
ncbi:Sodium/glucose cotransporter 2 [Dissostichus eleginoides]|uniref:Sodium/glucose cotransporter 2 n=1 Tax=Dissostichus eleginoides TaxID=100907 RepID=A0AAD9CHZ9_DISEL|nr:Sodium/glucose cotransporter 2 [Dissostichus eleginoides]